MFIFGMQRVRKIIIRIFLFGIKKGTFFPDSL